MTHLCFLSLSGCCLLLLQLDQPDCHRHLQESFWCEYHCHQRNLHYNHNRDRNCRSHQIKLVFCCEYLYNKHLYVENSIIANLVKMISSILLAGLARVSIFQWIFTEDKSEIRTLGSEWCHWDKFKGQVNLKEKTLCLGHQVNNDEDLTWSQI